jgi:hypothetical protein
MAVDTIFDDSDGLATDLQSTLDMPLLDGSARVRLSGVACSMSLEHWHAARTLLRAGLLPSGLVVHRAQFEALVRSIWILYAASDDGISKLSTELNLESEQAAKNMPQMADMMVAIAKLGPPQAYEALARFKENSWKALNSYAHAGIHPLRRHEAGYPRPLIEATLRNANGLGILCGMQAVVLSGQQPLQKSVLELAKRHSTCMPPPL